MGRQSRKAHKRKFNNEKNFNRPRGEGQSGGQDRPGYNLSLRHNEMFVKYYQGQGVIPDEEWDEFYSTCKKNLLITFRITGYKRESKELLKNIKGNFFSNMLGIEVEGEKVPPPKSLAWYPDELAWQVDLTRKVVRSSEPLKKFHEFLIAATECGVTNRQEAVSMIPPLCLDIKSHHKILDMCAAPGSKTAQLIEYLHADAPPGTLPTGHVIANDNDNKRCYLMVHQVKRLQSPCCMIVNHDASHFPKIRTNTDDKNPKFQMFDRILCDVPCSGDGTMRKNFDVWTKWHPLQGCNMHGLQVKILQRGVRLLAVGGRLVYSTCSLNPIEDEAVLAEVIKDSGGAVKLVDFAQCLPNLKYKKGVSTWKVMTRTGEWVQSPEELPEGYRNQFPASVFPPTEEEAKSLELDKCIRILPHQQDTGGFFVAVLEKMSHIPGTWEAKAEAEAEAEAAAPKQEEESEGIIPRDTPTPEGGDGQPPAKKQRQIHGYKEDPFFFLKSDDPKWPQVKDFFGLKEGFPASQILYRSQAGQRTLYFVSEAIRDITQCNENRVRFINMGVKAFSRSPSPLVPQCDFRITMDCIGTMLPFVTHRIVNINKKDAIIICSEENPFTNKLSEGAVEQLDDMCPGSTIFVFNPSEADPVPDCEILFVGWRGKTSVRCFGTKLERTHMLSLLGEDINEINARVQEKKRLREEAKKLAEGENQPEDPSEDCGVKEEVENPDQIKEEGIQTEATEQSNGN